MSKDEFKIYNHATYTEREAHQARRVVKSAKIVLTVFVLVIASIPFWFLPPLTAAAVLGVAAALIALVAAPFWVDWLKKKHKIYKNALNYGVREE